jgi:hypothetical protein
VGHVPVAWAEAAGAAAVRKNDNTFRLARQDHVAFKALLTDGYTAGRPFCVERIHMQRLLASHGKLADKFHLPRSAGVDPNQTRCAAFHAATCCVYALC